MVRLPIALFFSASRSKNWSSLALSSVCAWAAVNNVTVRKVANNIFLVFIKVFLLSSRGRRCGGLWNSMSDVSEQRRKHDHDHRGPPRVNRHITGLPPFQARK